jgi:hypothetical protein
MHVHKDYTDELSLVEAANDFIQDSNHGKITLVILYTVIKCLVFFIIDLNLQHLI